MSTTEGHARNSGATKRQRFSGKITDGDRTVSVGDLVKTRVPAVTARRVELAAQRGPTGYGSKRAGLGRVEDRVGLRVAFLARSALYPNDVATGV